MLYTVGKDHMKLSIQYLLNFELRGRFARNAPVLSLPNSPRPTDIARRGPFNKHRTAGPLVGARSLVPARLCALVVLVRCARSSAQVVFVLARMRPIVRVSSSVSARCALRCTVR
jgi:hypothetical protein